MAERLPQLRKMTVRFYEPFTLGEDVLLLVLPRRNKPAVLHLCAGWHADLGPFSLNFTGATRTALLSQLPRLERPWLPRQCKVRTGQAVSKAGRCCR
jgi:hypothetical protein